MEQNQQTQDTEKVSIRTSKEERMMFISLIGSLADDYMQTEVEKLAVSSGQEALKGLVLQEKRNAVWHFVDHVAVKWGVENPFRLEPATEEQQEVVNKEENGNQQEEDPNAA